MDDFVKQKLNEWGMESLIPHFQDQEIDKYVFEDLDENMLFNILNKTGPRKKFWDKYLEYKSNIESNVMEETLFEEIEFGTQNDDLMNSQIDTSILNPDFVSQIITYQDQNSMQDKENFNATASCPPKILDELDEPYDNNEKLNDYWKNFVDSSLKCFDGDLIIRQYNADDQMMDNNSRNLLANVLINHEYDRLCIKKGEKFKISTDKLMHMSKAITLKFPNENREIYFSPYIHTPRKLATGKLWEVYNTKKKLLKKYIPNDVNESQDFIISNENSEKLKFLKAALEPIEKIKVYWSDTYDARVSMKLEIFDILKMYPILRTRYGVDLLKTDFEKQYSENTDLFIRDWDSINKKLLTLISKKYEKKIFCNKEFLWKSNIVNGLFIIPQILFSTIATNRKRKFDQVKHTSKSNNTDKPNLEESHNTIQGINRTECQDTFLLHATDIANCMSKLDYLKVLCQKQQTTLQPLPIVIGSTIHEIEKSYIYIDGELWESSSPIHAFDTCFKCIFALNAKYPKQSEYSWMFIQKFMYKINTTYDKLSTPLNCLMTDIQNLK